MRNVVTAVLVAIVTAACAPPESELVVTVDSGQLQGAMIDGVAAFKGIPYAAPPVGEWRWRPPRPAVAARRLSQCRGSIRACGGTRLIGSGRVELTPGEPGLICGT